MLAVSSILDDVIRGVNAATPADRSAASSRFSNDIKLYIAVSVATGLFGSIRSLCFSLVGSKISNDVRNQLYTSILRQDVAFFDSITSGELTSRLARDTEGMVSPMQVRPHSHINTHRPQQGAHAHRPAAVEAAEHSITGCRDTSPLCPLLTGVVLCCVALCGVVWYCDCVLIW